MLDNVGQSRTKTDNVGCPSGAGGLAILTRWSVGHFTTIIVQDEAIPAKNCQNHYIIFRDNESTLVG